MKVARGFAGYDVVFHLWKIAYYNGYYKQHGNKHRPPGGIHVISSYQKKEDEGIGHAA